ncbi:MAG: flagellar basal body P-ring formation chaperone FlgA [Schwartzia succinivorans]|nr:flagellar basal body P-ring formation chaperone FlgA [Schwartzia succinivorans]
MRKLCFTAVLLWCVLTFPLRALAYTPADAAEMQTVSQEQMKEAAEAFLHESLEAAVMEGRYELECVHLPRPMEIPLGAVSFQVQTSGGLRFWGNTSVEITPVVDGVPSRTIRCHYRIHLYDNIVVAARPLQPETPLTAADVRLEEREIGTKGKRFFTRIDEVLGKVTARPVTIGRALERSMIKSKVVLQPGTLVTLVASVNGVEVKMEGTTLQPGREGEIIRVRNNSSRRIIRAKVIDATTVEVV